MSPATLPIDFIRGVHLHEVRVISDGLVTGKPVLSWDKLAEACSLWGGGQWYPGHCGLTWRNGSQSWWIVEPALVPGILEARAVVQGLGLDCGWSIGSAATSLLKWVDPPAVTGRDYERLQEGVSYSHIHANPGSYPNCQHYDVTSYYYTLLGTLPSLQPKVLSSGKIIFTNMSHQREYRYNEVYERIGACKPLRNALVGVMIGRTKDRPYYFRGERKLMAGLPGPFSAAAWCVVRAGWELTHLAAKEVEAPWSHTDAVLAREGRWPSIWSDHGFQVRSEGEGLAEVCTAITYNCGRKSTTLYDRGSRYQLADPLPADPPFYFYPSWLRRTG